MLEDFVGWCRGRQRELQIDDSTCAVLQRLVEAYRSECSAGDEPPQIKLTHACRSNACDINNTSCALCKNTLVKRCTRLVKQRYRDVEPVQALCKGLITCQLQEVPGTVTDQVTHFRVYVVDSDLYGELKSQLGREPRWSELQDLRRRIVIHQSSQATTGIFQRVSSDYFPLNTTKHQGNITADIGGSGQSMVITVSSHKFTVRRKLGYFRLLVVAGREAPNGAPLTDADAAPILDSILPAVSEPFKVGTAPYVEEPLKMSYPIERLSGIGRNLEGVFHELRRHSGSWADQELAGKVLACLSPTQSGIETVEEFLQFAQRLSAEPPVVDRLKTTLNAARLQEAVQHAKEAVYPDSVPRIFTTMTPEGSWGLVYAVEDGALLLDAGPIEYIFQSAVDNSRSRFEPRGKEAAVRQELLRDLHAQARDSWYQEGHRNWSFVTTSANGSAAGLANGGAAAAAMDTQGHASTGPSWAQAQQQAQQPAPQGRGQRQLSPSSQRQPSPGSQRGRGRGRGRQPAQAVAVEAAPLPPQGPQEYQPGPMRHFGVPGYQGSPTAEEGFGMLLGQPLGPPMGTMHELFQSWSTHPASEPFMNVGPPSPSWPGASTSGAPTMHPPTLPRIHSGAPVEALAYLASGSSSPATSPPSTLPHSPHPPPADLPSLDAGIGPGSPRPPPPPSVFSHPPANALAMSMPTILSAPNHPWRIPGADYSRGPAMMIPLNPAISDPHPIHAAPHHPMAPLNHHHGLPPTSHQAPPKVEFSFNQQAARTITTTSQHAHTTFPTASTSPPFRAHLIPSSAPFPQPDGQAPLPSPWVPQPPPGHGPQLGSTPTQSGLPSALSPFHDSCPAGTRQAFPQLDDFEPEEAAVLVEQLQNSSLDPHAPGDTDAQAHAPTGQARRGGKRAPLDERPGDPNTSTHMRPRIRQHHADADGAGPSGQPSAPQASAPPASDAANGGQLPGDGSSSDLGAFLGVAGSDSLLANLLDTYPLPSPDNSDEE